MLCVLNILLRVDFLTVGNPKFRCGTRGLEIRLEPFSVLKILADKRKEAAMLEVFSEMWIAYTQSHIRLP